MKLARSLGPFVCSALLGVAAWNLSTTSAQAQDFSRKGRLEILSSGMFGASHEASRLISDSGDVTTVTFKDFYGGGLGLGYNLTEHLNLNGGFNLGTVETRAGTKQISTDAFATMFDADIDWNLLKSRFTPLLTGGIGYSYFWDKFSDATTLKNWDYAQPTFAIGGGFGFRWDFSEHVFMKAIYRANWNIGISNLKDDLLFHQVVVSLGYAF